MAEHATTGLTWADLQHFPDDGLRRELLDGVLHVTPAPSPRHQEAVLRIARALFDVVVARGGKVYTAPLDVVFDESNVVEPDVVAFLPEHTDRIGERLAHAAPDLAAEVFSPSTRRVVGATPEGGQWGGGPGPRVVASGGGRGPAR